MVTVSHIINNLIRKKPFLEEALGKDIINYAGLAREMIPEVEAALGKEVKSTAVMMALRRFQGGSRTKRRILSFRGSDVTLKSDIFEATYRKSPANAECIRKLYDTANMDSSDFLAIIQGVHEMTIIASMKQKDRIAHLFRGEAAVKSIDGLCSLTIRIPLEAVDTPGFFYEVTKAFNWENINIIEIVSTLTEMTLVIKEGDAAQAFNLLKDFTRER